MDRRRGTPRRSCACMCVVWMVIRMRQSGGRCALYRTPAAASRTAISCSASRHGIGRRKGSRVDGSFRQGTDRLEGRRVGAWLCSCIHGCRRAILSCVCALIMASTPRGNRADASVRQGISRLEGCRAGAWFCSCIHVCGRAVLSCVCAIVITSAAKRAAVPARSFA